MKTSDVQIRGNGLVLATPADVEELEARLWIRFPCGYRDYVTRLGEGVLGDFVRIYPPWRIDHDLVGWRRRIKQYWFWDKGKKLLPKERALECVIIGDTVGGDELVFHPTRPEMLFVMPRGGEKVFLAGAHLMEAVEWLCHSGKLVRPFHEQHFEPFDSREELKPTTGEVEDPPGQTLDDLVDLANAWAVRHSMRKFARRALKATLIQLAKDWSARHSQPRMFRRDLEASYHGKPKKSRIIRESLLFEASDLDEPGYMAEYEVADTRTGLEVGIFRFNQGQTTSYQYLPNESNIRSLRKRK